MARKQEELARFVSEVDYFIRNPPLPPPARHQYTKIATFSPCCPGATTVLQKNCLLPDNLLWPMNFMFAKDNFLRKRAFASQQQSLVGEISVEIMFMFLCLFVFSVCCFLGSDIIDSLMSLVNANRGKCLSFTCIYPHCIFTYTYAMLDVPPLLLLAYRLTWNVVWVMWKGAWGTVPVFYMHISTLHIHLHIRMHISVS